MMSDGVGGLGRDRDQLEPEVRRPKVGPGSRRSRWPSQQWSALTPSPSVRASYQPDSETAKKVRAEMQCRVRPPVSSMLPLPRGVCPAVEGTVRISSRFPSPMFGLSALPGCRGRARWLQRPAVSAECRGRRRGRPGARRASLAVRTGSRPGH
jgi:hypothetical protein